MIKFHRVDSTHLIWHCPGCEGGHMVPIAGDHPVWSWNGSLESPTLTPSILVRGVHPLTDAEAARVFDGEKIEPRPLCCHSIITNGKIQFLDDCTHRLKGQTVEVPDWDE